MRAASGEPSRRDERGRQSEIKLTQAGALVASGFAARPAHSQPTMTDFKR